MVRPWVQRLKPLLEGDGTLSDRVLAEAMIEAARVDRRDLEFALSVVGDDAVFLPHYCFRQVVRDDLEIEEARLLVTSRRALFQRMARLLPEVISYLDTSDENIRYAVERVHDTCVDFQLSRNYPRVDKLRGAARAKLGEAITSLTKVAAALENARDLMDFEFGDVWEVEEQGPSMLAEPLLPSPHFDDLLRRLQVASAVAEYQLADLKRDRPRHRVIGGSRKADLVESVYDLHRQCRGPELSTTPGSHFSYLCGLMFEIVSGVPDQGLAGAISRFARSHDRREQDAYDCEIEADQEAIDSNDNFHGVRTRGKYHRDKADELSRLAKEISVSNEARMIIDRQIAFLLRRAELIEGRIGPHIVWADQDPRYRSDQGRDEFSRVTEEIRELDVRIGEYRRRLRAIGIDPNLAERGGLNVNSG